MNCQKHLVNKLFIQIFDCQLIKFFFLAVHKKTRSLRENRASDRKLRSYSQTKKPKRLITIDSKRNLRSP